MMRDKLSEAIKEFEKLGFPDKKLEAWKYTSLKNVLNDELNHPY